MAKKRNFDGLLGIVLPLGWLLNRWVVALSIMNRAALSDRFRQVRKLTPSRVWNAAKAFAGFYFSRYTGRAIVWGMPVTLSVEPTTSCNLRCPECPSGLRAFTRPTGMLAPANFTLWLQEVAPTLTWLTFYFQGEPFLNQDITAMIAAAEEKGVYTSTSTNAHFLSPQRCREIVRSGLSRLIISIDGTTQETYEQYRIGGHLNKVLEGTKNLLAAKRELKSATPYVIFQFLCVRPNEHQVEDVYRLARELGVDQVAIKTAQVYDYENGNPLIPHNPKYARYVREGTGKWKVKGEFRNECRRMWLGSVVTWDGKVVPCCFDKDASHVLGQLTDGPHPFRQIWHSEPYYRFRKKLLTARQEIDICTNCTEGAKVYA